jgi:hypothetical protein
MAAGFFWAFMVFFSDEKAGAAPWWRSALLFGAALVIGVGIAAIQLAPFAQYLPFSPRGVAGSSSTGWEYAIGWSMPPEELLNSVWPAFSGMLDEYWGRNQFKLHSEYIGAAVVLLALLSFRLSSHRRLAWFFVFLAIYGALFAFGGYTPFYYIPYALLPLIKGTRAVSMIFTLTSFSIAVLAAFGTQWLASRATVVKVTGKTKEKVLSDRTIAGVPRPMAIGVIVLGVFALLAAAGAWRPLMESFQSASRYGNAACYGNLPACIDRSYPGFIADAFRVLIFGIAMAAMTLVTVRRRWTTEAWALAVAAIVLIDLYTVERRYLRFSPRASETLGADDVVRTLQRDSTVFRILPLHPDYGTNYLMMHGLRTVLGYNAQEIHRYDELLGGKNAWADPRTPWPLAGNPNLWSLLGVKYLILGDSITAPIIERVAGPLTTYSGRPAYVYRAVNPAPYAYLVRDALRVSQGDDQIFATVLNPRFDPRRLLLVPGDAPVGRDSLAQLPPAVDIPTTVRATRAGHIEVAITTPPADSMYLYVAENWFPYWNATVDGRPAPLVRAQGSLMAVRVPPGARSVVLQYHSDSYVTGRTITLVTVLTVIALIVGSAVMARRRTAPLPVPAGAAA